MAANIQWLKDTYQRLASINGGSDLAGQIAWLTTTFLGHATKADGDSIRASQVGSNDGTNTQFQFAGSTAEERARAIDLLLNELTAQLNNTAAMSAPAFLTPAFVHIPR